MVYHNFIHELFIHNHHHDGYHRFLGKKADSRVERYSDNHNLRYLNLCPHHGLLLFHNQEVNSNDFVIINIVVLFKVLFSYFSLRSGGPQAGIIIIIIIRIVVVLKFCFHIPA